MDSRVFRMAVLTIISAFVLVLLIVYATNSDKINRMFGWGQQKESSNQAVAEASAQEVSVEQETVYGEQIGDSLNAFLLDDDFFDETETVPSVMVRRKNQASGGNSGEDGTMQEEKPEERDGTGMAIVGELFNPSAEGTADNSGYLTSLPEAPAGGYGQYVPPNQTITGTPVGTP